jgi:fucose permease
MALMLAVLGGVLALARRRWNVPASAPDPRPVSPPVPPASALGALTFTAVETGIESGAGIWGYLFLTAGRGLPPAAAGVAVAAYWAMMCAGRVVLGPVAERLGPARVLAAAVAGVPLGAALMALPISGPGSGALAVAGLMLLGLAAAPVFPLFTLTTGTTRMVSLQVAASAVGGAALPAALGLLLGAAGPQVLAPSLLALSLAMGGLYAFIRRG